MSSKTKFFIHTTGCKANQWDSYLIANRLKETGFIPCPMPRADFIIINACTLTEGAERDLRRFINRASSTNKGARVILAGCHAQVYPDQAFGADLVLGQDEKFRVDEFLAMDGLFVRKTRSIPMESMLINGLPRGRTRIFLKIQDGCDQFCAYCIVPFARGKSRSRTSEEIIRAMKIFSERGIKEVVLTGIELSAYKDPVTGTDLKGLLQTLEHEETPPRIRISSIDPVYLDDECIRTIASSTKIMKSLHIPVQSGSDDILKKMGRHYTKEYIGDLVKKLNNMLHGVGIGMDVMVGFPTEDESNFTETYRFLDSLDIYYLHVFPFSARKGTKAATMEDTVKNSVKKERVGVLRRLDSVKRRRFHERFIGQTACILAEGKVYRNNYMRGYTENYIPVCIPYEKSLENNLVNVTIKEIGDNLVIGEPVKSCDDHFLSRQL
jgi:threonylcarbamoyladenosine tRNA methylthiotransferase MtaB